MSDINPAQLTQAGNINNTALYNTQGQNSSGNSTHTLVHTFKCTCPCEWIPCVQPTHVQYNSGAGTESIVPPVSSNQYQQHY